MTESPFERHFSSTYFLTSVLNIRLVRVAPLLDLVQNWSDFLLSSCTEAELDTIRRQERTGRPYGDDSFVEELESLLHRQIKPKKRGPKPKNS